MATFLQETLPILNKLQIHLQTTNTLTLLRIDPEDIHLIIQKYTYTTLLIKVLFLIIIYWKQPRYKRIGE